jgi:type III secretion system (T3SS) SseB-like protein
MNSAAPPERAKAVVFVPAHPEVLDGREHPAAEVRQRPDGRRELPVFSSLERLVQTLGQYQPWVALPLEKLQRAAYAAGVDRIPVDPAASPDAWRWDSEDLDELRGKLMAAREGVVNGPDAPERRFPGRPGRPAAGLADVPH